MISATSKLSAKNVWGKIVLFLKERKLVALHVACGDITDVSIIDDTLIIKVKDGMLYDMLTEGKRDIESAVRWQGLSLQVLISKIEDKPDPKEEDIKKLKDKLGQYLEIYGGE